MECDGNSQRVRAKKEQVTNTEGVDVKCVIGIDGKDDAFVLLMVVLVLVLSVCDGSVLDFLDFLRNGFQLLDFLDFLEVDVVDVVEDVEVDVMEEDIDGYIDVKACVPMMKREDVDRGGSRWMLRRMLILDDQLPSMILTFGHFHEHHFVI